ncbi:MAG: lipoyl(octanoyl) transferase LipB [Gemmatimonadetes bacterium]|nr:lipoyl(octanoyl) transferase LipB [Gemmatimonadota bacterium]
MLPCWVVRAGTMEYGVALSLQRSLLAARRSGLIDNVLLILEHPPTYTIGRRLRASDHLLYGQETLEARGIRVYETDRGGDITCHGPGQLVGYTIFDIAAWYQDVYRYLRDLEAVMIGLLGDFGIAADRLEGITGVWVEDRKVAALGIRVSRWIAMHGFSLNVHPDLTLYEGIVPCGIADREVTSIERILGRPVAMEEVETGLLHHLGEVFEMSFEEMTLAELQQRI